MFFLYIPLILFILAFLWKSYQLYKYKTEEIIIKDVEAIVVEHVNK